jgi:hypothetical protein
MQTFQVLHRRATLDTYDFILQFSDFRDFCIFWEELKAFRAYGESTKSIFNFSTILLPSF